MAWVTLEPLHIEFADKIARWRRNAAVDRSRPAHNGAPVKYQAALSIDVLGARAEAAGKLYLNPIRWNAYAESVRDLADLGDWIDVKGRAKSWHDLIVQRDDPAPVAGLRIS